MQLPVEEAMTEHCEDRTCSVVAVTEEPAEQSPSRPCVSGDPSGTHTLSQGVVTAFQEAQCHKRSSNLLSQVQDLHVHNMDPPGGQSTQETSTVVADNLPSSADYFPLPGDHLPLLVANHPSGDHHFPADDHLPCLDDHLPPTDDNHFPGDDHLPPPDDQNTPADDHLPPLDDHHTPADDHLPRPDDQAVCCSSYLHNANLNHTFAAYCHPQPIPAPAQVLPQAPLCTAQHAGEPPVVPGHFSLPFLISSIGEMDLDAKNLIQCCNLSCTWSSKPPPPPPLSRLMPPCQQSSTCCRSSAGQAPMISRDMGTMTTITVLRDVAVQTGQTPSYHVFPHICLADENGSDTSAAKTLQHDRKKNPESALKSPVKEVKWDAEGMTWEVYGASVDPEELGLAIQKHLEQQIKETASRAAKLAHQNTSTSSRQRGWLVASLRGPGCCSRRTTAKD